MKVLFGIKRNAPDWMEELITEQEAKIGAAMEWAIKNGFDRFRVADIPDRLTGADIAKGFVEAIKH